MYNVELDTKNYEIETLKSYFIRNELGLIFSDEGTLYRRLARKKTMQKQDSGVEGMPGGMTTTFFEEMGMPAGKNNVHPYGYFLAVLQKNNIELEKREPAFLKEFSKYYQCGKDIEKFLDYCGAFKFQNYSMSDVIVTTVVYKYFIGSNEKNRLKIQKFLTEAGLTNPFQSLEVENSEYIAKFLKEKILPPVTRISNPPIKVNDISIGLIENVKILYDDLVVMTTFGLGFRGYYKPVSQIGAYLGNKLQGNLLNLDKWYLFYDEILRRKYKFNSIADYWNVDKSTLPRISVQRGYSVFPFFNINREYGEDQIKLYCVWFSNGDYVILDEDTLQIILPKLKFVEFTDSYYSRFDRGGVVLPCVPVSETLVPLNEVISLRKPKDGDFNNLTMSNLVY